MNETELNDNFKQCLLLIVLNTGVTTYVKNNIYKIKDAIGTARRHFVKLFNKPSMKNIQIFNNPA